MYLNLEIESGDDIYDVIENARCVSDKLMINVYFTHNNKRYIVLPGDFGYEIIERAERINA